VKLTFEGSYGEIMRQMRDFLGMDAPEGPQKAVNPLPESEPAVIQAEPEPAFTVPARAPNDHKNAPLPESIIPPEPDDVMDLGDFQRAMAAARTESKGAPELAEMLKANYSVKKLSDLPPELRAHCLEVWKAL